MAQATERNKKEKGRKGTQKKTTTSREARRRATADAALGKKHRRTGMFQKSGSGCMYRLRRHQTSARAKKVNFWRNFMMHDFSITSPPVASGTLRALCGHSTQSARAATAPPVLASGAVRQARRFPPCTSGTGSVRAPSLGPGTAGETRAARHIFTHIHTSTYSAVATQRSRDPSSSRRAVLSPPSRSPRLTLQEVCSSGLCSGLRHTAQRLSDLRRRGVHTGVAAAGLASGLAGGCCNRRRSAATGAS